MYKKEHGGRRFPNPATLPVFAVLARAVQHDSTRLRAAYAAAYAVALQKATHAKALKRSLTTQSTKWHGMNMNSSAAAALVWQTLQACSQGHMPVACASSSSSAEYGADETWKDGKRHADLDLQGVVLADGPVALMILDDAKKPLN